LKNGGIIIIDDWFVEESCNIRDENILTRSDLLRQITTAGMMLRGKLPAFGGNNTAGYDTEYFYIS